MEFMSKKEKIKEGLGLELKVLCSQRLSYYCRHGTTFIAMEFESEKEKKKDISLSLSPLLPTTKLFLASIVVRQREQWSSNHNKKKKGPKSSSGLIWT
jgi:hypothetical protein